MPLFTIRNVAKYILKHQKYSFLLMVIMSFPIVVFSVYHTLNFAKSDVKSEYNYFEIENDLLKLRFHSNKINKYGYEGFNGLSIQFFEDALSLNIPHYSLMNFEYVIAEKNKNLYNPRSKSSLKEFSFNESGRELIFNYKYVFDELVAQISCRTDKQSFLSMNNFGQLIIDCQYRFKSHVDILTPLTFFFASYLNNHSEKGFYFFENGELKYFEAPKHREKALIAYKGTDKPDFWLNEDSGRRFSEFIQISAFNNGYKMKSSFQDFDLAQIKPYFWHSPSGGGWAAHDFAFSLPLMQKNAIYSIQQKIKIAKKHLLDI